jgi:four helix bundle protein
MMKYERFEDLPVWQLAAEMAAQMFEWTMHPGFRGKGDLANQLQRATLSISNNIAEGFERGTTNELISFLYYARGSAGEVRSMLQVMKKMQAFGDLHEQIAKYQVSFESISRQIRGWADSLQNSDFEGQRRLNDDSRRRYESNQRRKVFDEQNRQSRAEFEERLNREAAMRAEQANGGDAQERQVRAPEPPKKQ